MKTIENVDEETPLVITKTFEIQSYVRGFHFFQDFYRPKLGEIMNASNEDEPSSLVHDRYAIACKDKIGKTVGHIPKYVSKQMNFFIKYCGRVKMKVNDKWRLAVNGGLEILCMFSLSFEQEKMLIVTYSEECFKDVLSKK